MTIASKIDGLLPFLTLRLNESNYLKWSFQVRTVLGGHGLFGFLDGSIVCPPRFVLDEDGVSSLEVNRAFLEWDQTDKALISLLMASVNEDSMEYILDCSSAYEAWMNIKERYSTDSRATIMQFKTDFQTLQKGADNVERFLMRIKHAKAQLAAVGVYMNDEDVYVVALNGLPDEFDPVKAVLRGHQGPMSMKEFRSQLLAAEQDINKKMSLALASSHSMSAMVAKLPLVSPNNHSAHTTTLNAGNGGPSSYNVGENNNQSGAIFNGSGGYQVYSHDNHSHSSGGGYNPGSGYNHAGRWNSNQHGGYWNGGRNGNGRFNNGGRFNSNGGRGWHNGGNGGRNGNWGSTGWNNGERNNNWGNTSWNNGAKQVPECQICGKRGHTAANCYDRDRSSQHHASSSIVECQICGKRGHVALDCYHRSNYAYQGHAPPQSLNALTAQANIGFASEDVWLADTGATHHMTSDLHNLTIVEPFASGEKITVGSGEGQCNTSGAVQRKE